MMLRRQDPTPTSKARRTARFMARGGTVLVAAAAVFGGFCAWGGPLWRASAALFVIGAAAGTLGWLLRVAFGTDSPRVGRGWLAGMLVFYATAWSIAAVFGLSLSSLLHEHRLDDAATETVTATVTHCQEDANASKTCVYHWTAGGRPHAQTDHAGEVWPDGHRLTVRVNPSDPDAAAVIDPDYLGRELFVAFGAIGMPVSVLILFGSERDEER